MSRRLATAGFALLAALVPAGWASAQTIKVVTPAEIKGRIMELSGPIEEKQADRLIGEIATAQKNDPDLLPLVSLSSTGGAVLTAETLGRYLRQRGIGTLVLPGKRCYSACALIFFSGYNLPAKSVWRLAFQGASLGVHQVKPFKDDRPGPTMTLAEATARAQTALGARTRYMVDMKVSNEIQSMQMQTPPKSMWIVPRDVLLRGEVFYADARPPGWFISGSGPVDALYPMVREPPSMVRAPDAAPPPVVNRPNPPPTAALILPEPLAQEPLTPEPRVAGKVLPVPESILLDTWQPAGDATHDRLVRNLHLSPATLRPDLLGIIDLYERNNPVLAMQRLDGLPQTDPNVLYLRAVLINRQFGINERSVQAALAAAAARHPRGIALAADAAYSGSDGRGGDRSRALELYRDCAALGEPDCQVAVLLRDTAVTAGGPEALDKARKQLEDLARSGQAELISGLASALLMRPSTTDMAIRAAELERRAAELGDPAAMVRVAQRYRSGIMAPRDSGLFLLWLFRAERAGSLPASAWLGRSLVRGEEGYRDIVRGLASLSRAADANNGAALYELFTILRVSTFVPRDPEAAYLSLIRSNRRGTVARPDMALQLTDELGPAAADRLEARAAVLSPLLRPPSPPGVSSTPATPSTASPSRSAVTSPSTAPPAVSRSAP